MDQLLLDLEGLGLDDDSSPVDSEQATPEEVKILLLERCMQSLSHACQCNDADCQLNTCKKMKRVIQHSRICKWSVNGNCPLCKGLFGFCCYHAKYCQEPQCLIPFCSNIKLRMGQQQLRQAQLLHCMMAALNATRAYDVPGVLGGAAGATQAPPGVNNEEQQLEQQWQELLFHCRMAVQEEAASQQVTHAAYSEVAPAVAPVMPPPQMQMAQMPQGPSSISMEQWQPRYPTTTSLQLNTGLQQQNPQLLQSAAQGAAGQNSLPMGAETVGLRQPQQNFGQYRQVLQQLLQLLRSPESPEQRQQILHILRSNPQLMAEFNKHRGLHQQQQRK